MKLLGQRNASLQAGLLAALAAVIGVYLISTTVMVARDGVFYVNQARKLAGDLPGEPEIHLLGFPLMISAIRWVLVRCGMGGGVGTWIISAQVVALLARILCLIPVYLMGKRFVGSRRSVLGLLVLIMLPLQAEWGADALRDFPSLLFLLGSLALLIIGAESGRIWIFALAGLACGIGTCIREEILQLLLYAVLWFTWRTVAARTWPDRARQIAACVLFMATALLPAAAHVYASDGHLPAKTTSIMLLAQGSEAIGSQGPKEAAEAAGVKLSVWAATYKLVRILGNNLHEYFYPFWIIGLISCLRKKGNAAAKFFILAMMIGTVALIYARYFIYFGGLSKRYLLPISVGTIFFVAEGLRVVGLWGEKLIRAISKPQSRSMRKKIRISTILAMLGIAACLPKLLTPTRWEKRYYLEAAKRVEELSNPDDNIWTSEHRIPFYAGRKVIPKSQENIEYDYHVIIRSGDPRDNRTKDQIVGWTITDTIMSTRKSDKKYILIHQIDPPPKP